MALRKRSVPAPWVPAVRDAVDTSHFDPRMTAQQHQDDGETDENDDSLGSENNPNLTLKEQALFVDFDSC